MYTIKFENIMYEICYYACMNILKSFQHGKINSRQQKDINKYEHMCSHRTQRLNYFPLLNV